MFNRGVRYLTYLGDGDSKGRAAVVESKPYGPDVNIIKAECIGHIQKRMGGRLLKLCAKWKKGDKLSDGLGLKGKGRLSAPVIDQLQNYYGTAIGKNTHDVLAMKRAIWAIFYHKRSTYVKPIHDFCPEGESSWCAFNRAKKFINTRNPFLKLYWII